VTFGVEKLEEWCGYPTVKKFSCIASHGKNVLRLSLCRLVTSLKSHC